MRTKVGDNIVLENDSGQQFSRFIGAILNDTSASITESISGTVTSASTQIRKHHYSKLHRLYESGGFV